MISSQELILEAIIETLSRISSPLKAREIVRLIASSLGHAVTKSDVNRILYWLKARNAAHHDNEFRWVLIKGLAAQTPVGEPEFVIAHPKPDPPPSNKPDSSIPLSEGKTECILGRIGYWNVLLRHIPSASKEIYIFRCTLCGFQIRRSSQEGSASPLSRKGRLARIGHANLKHPETQSEQMEAEDELLRQRIAIDLPPSRSESKSGEIDERHTPVDLLMKRPFDHRLTRGFKLLKGESSETS
jgi:hypothetical protein